MKRLLIYLPAAAIMCAVAGWQGGVKGFCSALMATMIVGVFFESTPGVLGPVATALPGMSLAAAMIFFMTKVFALLVLFVVLFELAKEDGPLDKQIFVIATLVSSLTWMFAAIVHFVTNRIPIYDLPVETQEPTDKL